MSGYPHRRRRSEAGQTTAEYVGIVVFVALLAVAVTGFITPIGSSAKSIVSDAYCKIGATLGGAGCSTVKVPTSNPVVPKGDPVVPKGDPVVPKGDPVVPKSDPVVPKSDPVVPKSDPVVPKSDPVVPNANKCEPTSSSTALSAAEHRWRMRTPNWQDVCLRNLGLPKINPDVPKSNPDVRTDCAKAIDAMIRNGTIQAHFIRPPIWGDWCEHVPTVKPAVPNPGVVQWGPLYLDEVQKRYPPPENVIKINDLPPEKTLPYYVPTRCNVSSAAWTGGGAVALGGKLKGETGYTEFIRRELMVDGTYKDQYVIRTRGYAGLNYEFGPKAGVAAGGVNARAGASVKLEGEVETGQNYAFDTEAEAIAFAKANMGRFGGTFGVAGKDGSVPELLNGVPVADSTYYQGGASATAQGESGPLTGTARLLIVLGAEEFKNGDTRYKLALTAEAALKLGIPARMMEVGLKAQGGLMVQADITFDKNWVLTRIGGIVEGTVQGEAGIDIGPNQGKTGAVRPDGSIGGIGKGQLPGLKIMAGAKGTLAFNTKLDDDKSRVALSDAVLGFIVGKPLSDENRKIIDDQLTNNSQVTFTATEYGENTTGGGLMFTAPEGSLGIEAKEVRGYEDAIDSYYYNPMTTEWVNNFACSNQTRAWVDYPAGFDFSTEGHFVDPGHPLAPGEFQAWADHPAESP